MRLQISILSHSFSMRSTLFILLVLLYQGRSFHGFSIDFRFQDIKRSLGNKITALVTAVSISGCSFPACAFGSTSYDINNPSYKDVFVNAPSDDFWYPPFLIGKWKTSLKFQSATFNEKVPTADLLTFGDLPGIKKYSVIFIPDIGSDVKDTVMKFVQLDSHPREDHPSNIRSLVHSSLPDAVVDSAPYYFQKAPDWFHSPSNSWKIKYHDNEGQGTVQLTTRRRDIKVFAGSVETLEVFHQDHERRDISKRPILTHSDYAINWKLAVPEALRDEFIPVEDLSKAKQVAGNLNILVYLQPSNRLYNQLAASPAAIYSYDVSMERMDDGTSTKRVTNYALSQTDTANRVRSNRKSSMSSVNNAEGDKLKNPEYPFVWRDDGPIDSLEEYFGY